MPAHVSCCVCGLIFHPEELDGLYTCAGCASLPPDTDEEGEPQGPSTEDHPPFSPPPPEPSAAEA